MVAVGPVAHHLQPHARSPGPFGPAFEGVAQVGLTVERLLSGPLGGDLQIGARLAVGQVDAVIFLRDPMTPQPHEPDINALVRACDVHDVPCATNLSSARLVLAQLLLKA